MSKPVYREGSGLVRDLSFASAYVMGCDVKGLTEKQRAIARALTDRATERQRECVYCYYALRMPQKEIAERLGITVPTVSRNISNGLRWVKQAMEHTNP